MDQDQTNHDQPHLVTHESKWINGDEHRRMTVTAFLCVYRLSQHFGGREEGGWWYDAYEFTGAAFPFNCEQEYVWCEWDDESMGNPNSDENVNRFQIDYDEETKKWMYWSPEGLPHVTDEPTRVRLESAWKHFESVFGEPGTSYRTTCGRPKGEDFQFVYELQPGARGNEPRPRYC